jgi:hypothetical protein
MIRLKLESTLDGKLINVYDDRSHSPVRNFYNAIYGVFINFTPTGSTFGAGYLTSKDITNTARNRVFGTAFGMVGPVNTSTYGIIVGRGSTAESFEQYSLATIITHGTGANQLSYTAQNATTVAYTSGTKTWDASLVRIMNNNSAGTITVTESCLTDYNGNSGLLMMCRDILASPVDVLAAGQLTVTYTVSIVYP